MTSSKSPDPGISAQLPSETVTGSALAKPVGLDELGIGWTILAASPDCVKLIGPDGRLWMLNSAGATLLELEDESAVLGRHWAELWPSEMRTVIDDALAAARSGRVVRFNGLCPTAKGTSKWWDVVLNPVQGSTGELEYFVCISRDITAQKTAESSLKASEQRFRALADNMAQFAWMAYPSGYIFWHNQRWLDFTGMDTAQSSGWGWQSAIHSEFAERVVQQLKHAFENGETWEDTFPLRGRDGEFRWFLSRAIPLRDDQGRVVLWCGTDTDITDQRRTSQRLMKQQRIIELSHEALLVWDLEDGIILFNRGCEELYGFKKNEALGANAADLLSTRYPMTREALLEHLASEGTWSGELLQSAKDGSEIWVDSRLALIRTGGRSFVCETNRDITERRKADEVRNLLVGELNHRVKNTLAIVQAIAAQTARTSGTINQFIAGFNGRIQSLSNAHHLLTEAHWSGASLRELVTSQIAVSAGEPKNVEIIGDDVFVPPQTALQMTLMLHELATNARKYGALSRPQGRVSVVWNRESGERPRIVLVWTERGGPPVAPPVARGFGTLLLERSGKLPHLSAALEFDPNGVVCRIEVDVATNAQGDQIYFNPGGENRRRSNAS